MAGKSSNNGNWSPGSPSTRYNASGKNREFYTFENAPGIGAYATGGTIVDGGDGYIYHIFTGNGTFAVNRPPAAIDSVDYLIVGGGGGASPSGSGGGGAGGFLFGNLPVSAPGSYPIQVGGGGPAAPGAPGVPRNGNPSYFGPGAPGTLVATGGGGGGATPNPPGQPGADGGSGGGGAPVTPSLGGSGNTPATIPRQGYPGGSGIGPTLAGGGGGGGGAGGIGANGAANAGGVGGPGRIAPEFPSNIVRRAIPAPVLPSWEPLVGPGGYAAGGYGSSTPAPLQRTSPVNTGYGGQSGGLAGGSGIVCVRYKKTAAYSRATGGTIEPNTHPEHPGVWRHIFTSPSNFTITDPTLQWIDYLAVGGGGGGGNGGGLNNAGAGGGGGGFVSSIHTSTTTPTTIPEAYPWNPGYSVEVGEQYSVGIGTYPIGIGTGGTAGTAGNNTTIGNPGGTQIIAYGGGAGGSNSNGGNGASGGGASKFAPSAVARAGGTATPTPLIQGNPGGGPTPATPGTGSAFGGGGAGGVASGAGGAGWYSVLSPSSYGTPGPVSGYRYFTGGGAGGFASSPSGGAGGGGDASSNGTTNTGGGGGGGAPSPTPISGGTGGSGIVIIQYPE